MMKRKGAPPDFPRWEELRAAKYMAVADDMSPLRKTVFSDFFPNTSAKAFTCGDMAYNCSNSCIFIRIAAQR